MARFLSESTDRFNGLG